MEWQRGGINTEEKKMTFCINLQLLTKFNVKYYSNVANRTNIQVNALTVMVCLCCDCFEYGINYRNDFITK